MCTPVRFFQQGHPLATAISIVVASGLSITCVKGQHTEDTNRDVRVSLSAHYSIEHVDWSIAGNMNGENPNIYSELVWKDLAGPGLELDVTVPVYKHLFVYSHLIAKTIVAGHATDTDYLGNNRTQPSFDVVLRSDRGRTMSAVTGAGYRFPVGDGHYIAPAIGYGVNTGHLYLFGPDHASRQALRSSYTTTWTGLAGTITAGGMLTRNLGFEFDFRYQQVAYRGKANWNLIETFMHPVSFRHYASGYGIHSGVKIFYRTTPRCTLFLTTRHYHWTTGRGRDVLFLASGETVFTLFNGISREGYGVGTGLHYAFTSRRKTGR